MKGAKYLLCDCGRFFVPVYIKEEVGKFTKLLSCKCGAERRIIIDGSVCKEVLLKDGIYTRTYIDRGYAKKVYRLPPEWRYRITSHLQKTNPFMGKNSEDI